jgi:hypothetical protein
MSFSYLVTFHMMINLQYIRWKLPAETFVFDDNKLAIPEPPCTKSPDASIIFLCCGILANTNVNSGRASEDSWSWLHRFFGKGVSSHIAPSSFLCTFLEDELALGSDGVETTIRSWWKRPFVAGLENLAHWDLFLPHQVFSTLHIQMLIPWKWRSNWTRIRL